MATAFEALEVSNPKPLHETDGCRWPIGRDHPFLFCNEQIDKSIRSMYCTAHAKIGLTPRSVKPRPVKTWFNP